MSNGTSALANAVSNTDAQAPPNITTPAPQSNGPDVSSPVQTPVAPGGGAPPQPSRLQAVLSAVANVVSTGLAGIPSQGRPSFVTGLGQGARSEQAAQATQQAIKMRSFDDSVRLANLHNSDLELQMRSQQQQDAHDKMQRDQADWDEAHGITFDPHPNDGTAVTQTLQAQTAANGTATVPPGTHLSADGNTVNIPSDDPSTQAGLLNKYRELAGVIPGIPAFPGMDKAQFVPPKNLDIMTHALSGYDPGGNPLTHEQLSALIPALQAQRDALAKNNATPYQLQTLGNLINIYQANEKNHQDAEDKAAAIKAQQAGAAKGAEKTAELAAENSPEAIAGAAAKAGAIAKAQYPYRAALQDNAAGNKNAGSAGSPWLPKVGADEKKKAELAENIAYNANEVARIVMNRPDILGAIAGRFTNAQQMIGNNDPDISALGVHVHNMGMANSGVHGFRSQEGVESYERGLLNNFKNGPAAMAGALRASTGSVQTFIDNARPDTYKTHSKQGGAVRGMMETQ